MRCINYEAIDEATDIRFPGISCFDSVTDIQFKAVDYFHDTIIIEYHYRSEYYKHAQMFLQDMDFITVQRKKGEPFIRYCDVIDAIRGMEISGAIKPNDDYYLEGIVRVETNGSRIPMFRIQ
jgi:hypothetical protein